METLDHKAVLRRRHFLTALMVLAALTVMPVWAQVGLDVGQKAPDFSAAGLDGKTQRLSTVTAASRATVVYFWATWCPPCIGEFMEFANLSRRLKDQGVTLLSINFKETALTAKTFADDAAQAFRCSSIPMARSPRSFSFGRYRPFLCSTPRASCTTRSLVPPT
jgi:thiol-disulfide isomerase/thioredoxin